MNRPDPRLSLLPLLPAAVTTTPASAKVDPAEMSLEQLLEVTVTGTSKYEQKQSEVTAAVSVITRAEIKAHGWRTLAEALASLPGVYTTYDRQYAYLGTRGFGLPGDYTSRILLSVDGNRVNDVVFDQALVGREFPLDLDLIERIEFIPGPGGAVYGQNALFGVVNVVSRGDAELGGGEASAAYHDPHRAGEGRLSWGRRLDNGLDVALSVSGHRAKGKDLFFDYPGAGPGGADVSGVAAGMDGERDEEFYARLSRGPWSFDLVYGDHRKDDPTAAYKGDPLVPGQYQRDSSLLAQLQYREDFADNTLNLSGRLFLGRERFTGVFNYGTPYLNTGSGDWQGLELRLLATAWTGCRC